MNATAEMQWRSPVYRKVSSLSVASDLPEGRLNEAASRQTLSRVYEPVATPLEQRMAPEVI
jgi:hypothetical protein